MSYYVNKDAYRRAVRTEKAALAESAASAGSGRGGA
jgi:hypothetical protein